MSLLIASVAAEDLSSLAALADAALAGGADWVELRLDALTEIDAPALVRLCAKLPPQRWIAICRPTGEGGGFDGDTVQRIALLLAIGTAASGAIDFEFVDWLRSRNIQQKIALASTARGGDATGARLILSRHYFDRSPADPRRLVEDIERAHPDAIAKLAWSIDDAAGNLAALDLMRERPSRRIVIGMGEAGVMSRVLARKCGAYATYVTAPGAEPTAPGQVSLEQMLERYRWRSTDAATEVYGVIGWPVAQSSSPALFNAAFAQHQRNAVYLPLAVQPDEASLRRFVEGCLSREWLHFRGASVTHPHKLHAFCLVGDALDQTAREVGAVNTLVRRADKLWGYNTDYPGVVRTLEQVYGRDAAALDGVRAGVLGAGGVARAVVAVLTQRRAKVHVFARDVRRAAWAAERANVTVASWEDRTAFEADLWINCTPIGMDPHVDDAPLPQNAHRHQAIVFDTVYNPRETRLLRDARAVGCRTLGGLTLFVEQAAAQFQLWTGRAAEVETWLSLLPTSS